MGKREDIIQAAGKAFLEKGFEGASMDYIAQEAGASKQTVYSHFTGKEDLFSAVISCKCDAIWQSSRSDGKEDGEVDPEDFPPPEEFLPLLGRMFLAKILEPDAIAMQRLAISESERFPEVSQMMFEAGPRKGIAKFRYYLEIQCRKKNLIIEDTQMAAELFTDMVKCTPIYTVLMSVEDAPISQELIGKRVDEAVSLFLAKYGA